MLQDPVKATAKRPTIRRPEGWSRIVVCCFRPAVVSLRELARLPSPRLKGRVLLFVCGEGGEHVYLCDGKLSATRVVLSEDD